MEDVISGDMVTCTYHSLPEFADAAKRRQGMGPGMDGFTMGSGDDYRRHGFCGNCSRNDVLTAAYGGWEEHLTETLAIAESAVEMAIKEHDIQSFMPVWDVSGCEVDVARYLNGEPENMIDYPTQKVSKLGKVITLVASMYISAAIAPETIIRRGQVITAFAMALGQLGHACEMWIDFTIRDDKGRQGKVRVLVKGANDTLDPSRILFAYAHPGTLRYLMFAVMNGFPKRARPSGVGHGYGSHAPEKMESDPEGTIYLPKLRSDRDVPDAHEALKDLLKQADLLAES